MCRSFTLAIAFVSLSARLGLAQTPLSEPLAKTLVALMQQRQLESIGVGHADQPDRFSAVLLFPGQLLTVSARYASPPILKEQLVKRNFKDVYVQLSSVGEPADKFFVQDLGANGLQPTRKDGEPFDTVYLSVTNRTAFDGDWKGQKISESAYHERFRAADERYASLLAALVDAAKASSVPR